MNKVVISQCYGGFGLSEEAARLLIARGVKELEINSWTSEMTGKEYVRVFGKDDICRHDPRLVAVVEELGTKRASSENARLVVKEIPGNQYRIIENDGWEELEYPEMMENEWTVIDSPVGAR